NERINTSVTGNEILVTAQNGKLLPATAYALTIGSQVRGMGNAILAADVSSSFTTRDGAWLTAQLAETNNAQDAEYPSIATDPRGNAIAVWMQADATDYSLRASRFSAATGLWGSATPIENNPSGHALSPQVAVDSNGNALVVWRQFDGARYSIWANRFNAANFTWGTAAAIESDNAGDALVPRVAVDTNGNAIAVWAQSNGMRFNVFANRMNAAGTWSTPVLIETQNAGDASNPDIAFDAQGNALAVWPQSDGARYNILANRFAAATGSWGTATLIETEDVGDALRARIAMDATGNAFAVWEYQGVRANRYAASSNTWATAIAIHSGNPGLASDPQVGLDAGGNAFALWSNVNGSQFGIFANRYSAATNGWGTATTLDTGTANGTYAPQLAMSASGNALAIWRQYQAARYSIKASRYLSATGIWNGAVLIDAPTGQSYGPQIAADATGSAHAIWYQHDGTRLSIYGNRFE
ncbi:MAG TPA: hypothetical protein VK629_08740, partial [Steroidobacteraceae bacterium]|nr:hypothetical protein [Steroidobacteraceae bacterium]